MYQIYYYRDKSINSYVIAAITRFSPMISSRKITLKLALRHWRRYTRSVVVSDTQIHYMYVQYMYAFLLVIVLERNSHIFNANY